ncbi:MAG: hypothetical protein HN793_09530 [Rhodospirillaceae bacterium]|jgi:hypothetical protein|nr:hypothetical protein [Rhodospirillaceae bacterium]MBT5565729.1 hypothetical protein [Rhodospirillaceae bacterium]MBT6088544.1 hypothetical protein [Rhodospirillaceae bacterium]MBT6960381.1 hypothetical protein [Rhodospirillaceae bacterium]MBT7451059.1 hypothetical protein [Rhodospirillaceae bacterium]
MGVARSSFWRGIGLIWSIDRIAYALGYYKVAEKRIPDLGVSFIATLILVLGSVVVVVWSHI